MILRITRIGLPIALQDFLVGISFLLIQVIVNTLGVTASAGVGVAEKVCAFIMLVPVAFMQSMSAFVVMFYLSFFHGNILTSLFSKDIEVAAAGADYLKAYAIDCMLTPVFFCFIGFYNGVGLTTFVMAQGIISAFLVRVPVSYLMSRRVPVSLFHIGLATPCSSALQIVMCLCCMAWFRKRLRNTSRNYAETGRV